MSEMCDEEQDHVEDNLKGTRGYEESKDPSQHGAGKSALTSQIQKILHIQPQINESPFTFKNVFERREDKRILLQKDRFLLPQGGTI